MSASENSPTLHHGRVLPPLTRIPGLDLTDPYDLLDPEERQQLTTELDRAARARRTQKGHLA